MTSVRPEPSPRPSPKRREEEVWGEAAPPESIEELFAALESPLLAYALRIFGQREPAEDVVQEAFMKLHAQFAEVREPRKWLFRTVHNLALNHRRAAQKVVAMPQFSGGDGDDALSGAAVVDAEALPDEQIVRMEGIGLVRLSLAALDERTRAVVKMKFEEDLSYKEIAERTGLTAGHVGYVLHHALKSLAAELKRSGLLP
jgi:RNA polymerase sigma factor (sigma-70 family)